MHYSAPDRDCCQTVSHAASRHQSSDQSGARSGLQPQLCNSIRWSQILEANRTIFVAPPLHRTPPPLCPPLLLHSPLSSLATGNQIGPCIYHENTITFGLMWFAVIKRYTKLFSENNRWHDSRAQEAGCTSIFVLISAAGRFHYQAARWIRCDGGNASVQEKWAQKMSHICLGGFSLFFCLFFSFSKCLDKRCAANESVV